MLASNPSQSIEALVDVLPQTQCTKCGFEGCRPYAQAIGRGEAQINRCPPGGEAGILVLAHLIGVPVLPLDTQRGCEGPRRVAYIDESQCIGCAKCIQACPVDAIVGAAKRMHSVIADDCTGCDLCVAPCPVDCIEMRETMPDARPVPAWTPRDAALARSRYERRLARIDRERSANEQRLEAKAMNAPDERIEDPSETSKSDAQLRRAAVLAAIERANAKAAARRRT